MNSSCMGHARCADSPVPRSIDRNRNLSLLPGLTRSPLRPEHPQVHRVLPGLRWRSCELAGVRLAGSRGLVRFALLVNRLVGFRTADNSLRCGRWMRLPESTPSGRLLARDGGPLPWRAPTPLSPRDNGQVQLSAAGAGTGRSPVPSTVIEASPPDPVRKPPVRRRKPWSRSSPGFLSKRASPPFPGKWWLRSTRRTPPFRPRKNWFARRSHGCLFQARLARCTVLP